MMTERRGGSENDVPDRCVPVTINGRGALIGKSGFPGARSETLFGLCADAFRRAAAGGELRIIRGSGTPTAKTFPTAAFLARPVVVSGLLALTCREQGCRRKSAE